MRFSMSFEAQMVDTSRANEARVFHQALEQSIHAEEMGFDCVWAVEHTALTQYAHMSAPETFLAFLAGRTRRIHVGHGVVCLPPAMNHPVKVAERIATLDILSEGRLHFGVGKGGTQQEAGTFGYDLNELQPMIDESMYLIPKIMVEDEFEHDGKYIKIPRRSIHPKPYQTPHPPMYIACTRDATLKTAGARGIGALVLGFNTPEETKLQNEIYRTAFRNRNPADQVGYKPNEHLAAGCPALVLDDREKARRLGLRGQRFFVESIGYWYGGGQKPTDYDIDAEGQIRELGAIRERVVAFLSEHKLEVNEATTQLYNTDHAYGTPKDAIAYLERLEASGADEVMFLMQMGSIPHEAIMESITNIGKYVIPHFRQRSKRTARIA